MSYSSVNPLLPEDHHLHYCWAWGIQEPHRKPQVNNKAHIAESQVDPTWMLSAIGMVLGLCSKLGMVDASMILTLGKWRWENQRPQFRLLTCMEFREEPTPRLEGHHFSSLKNILLRHQQMALGLGRSESQ